MAGYLGQKPTPSPLTTSDLGDGIVTAAKLAPGVGDADTTRLEYNQAILAFKLAAQNSLAKFSMVDQVIDEYQDATGIDAGSSTNENAGGATTAKYYEGGTTVTPTRSGNYDSTATDGDYTYYKWTTVRSDGTFTTDTSQTYDFLVVAGGGGGGAGASGAGAGGAGGFRNSFGSEASGGGAASETALTFTGTISSITVGAGGAGNTGSGDGSDGSASSFSTISTVGGGGGGQASYGSPNVGHTGGSGGGGGAGESATRAGGSGTANQGYGGGTSVVTDYGGGGGGASAVGGNGVVQGSGFGGYGGAGINSSITGSVVGYAGGGGGGGFNQGGIATHGGGNGGDYNTVAAIAGTANTGGGGGGRSRNGTGANGGSGIVVIRAITSTTTVGGNLTLQSVATTAESAPTKADLVLLIEDNEGTATINTDIKAKVSRDGSAFTGYVTFTDEGDWGTNKRILVARQVDISGITSGTSMKYKIETFNQSAGVKETRIHATSLAWS
jgi:hypothetical protein